MENEYENWLKSLTSGDRVGVRTEGINESYIKEIVNISPRRIIKLRGWKHTFRNGRNEDGFRLEQLTEDELDRVRKMINNE